MASPPERLTLDDDVQEELQKLAERAGKPADTLANQALREYVRYEKEVLSSIERGVADLDAGRKRTTKEVLAFLAERRLARGRE